jgi:hypothetical protein
MTVNIAALATERAPTSACRPGLHGAAGGLWALAGMALFVSHHVYRNALEEHAHVGGLVNTRTAEEEALAGAVVPDGDIESGSSEYEYEYEDNLGKGRGRGRGGGKGKGRGGGGGGGRSGKAGKGKS